MLALAMLAILALLTPPGSCSHAWSTHIRTNNQVESEEGTTIKLPLVTACVCETFIRTSSRAQSMRFPPHSNQSVCPQRHNPFRQSSSRRHSSVKYKSNDAGESGGEGGWNKSKKKGHPSKPIILYIHTEIKNAISHQQRPSAFLTKR